eukprot:TRINITY_DN45135_c0_g1_i1.p1 TRINITY_DN45135_c0_g1~~TRINITY_DN45135_c0_g1_i1.p1  ORF type:complete len:121 (-),score=39.96 TRINITY_DN45135_c0_g1_i1:141-503(-)
MCFFFFSSRRRHTRCREVSWARRCVQETGTWELETSPGFQFFKDHLEKKGYDSINIPKSFSSLSDLINDHPFVQDLCKESCLQTLEIPYSIVKKEESFVSHSPSMLHRVAFLRRILRQNK